MAPPTKKRAPASKPEKKSIPIVGIVFAVVALLAVAAVVFTGSSGSSEAGDEYGAPQIEGQLSPMPQSSPVDRTVAGEVAPTVVGKDFDGATVTIENNGKAKAIVFLAHWCPHCQNEVPAIQSWLESGGGIAGTELLSISTAMDPTRDNYPASAWLNREGWTVPVIVDDAAGSIHSAYGAGPFPYWVFVNGDGTVAFRAAGELGVEQLKQFLSELS
jgi:thiol-disulfide isomerase/thioredoxin